MADPLKLFIVAGEASGDRIGGDLVKRLRARQPVTVTGVGGPELTGLGLNSLFPMDDLAVMGFADVLRRAPLLLWRLRQTARAIIAQRPDVVVLIDSQVFSHLLAQRVRRTCPQIKLVLYVAPTVWAWKPERAAELKPLFDELLAVLPFEPRVVADLGGPPTHYVGHPALDSVAWRDSPTERGPLLLLPGSRKGELKRHLEMMRVGVERLHAHPAVDGFVLPTPASHAERVRAATADWAAPVTIVRGEARYNAFSGAVGAFATSGTVTLELALAGVPMVIAYVADRQQSKRYNAIGRPPIGLPNIVAGQSVVPEMLFEAGSDTSEALSSLKKLMDDPATRQRQLNDFRAIRALMQNGAPEAPREDPADRVLAVAAQRSSMGT
ncbi:lipid-A-disaccharide synthase [Devosia sp.]|uniref:lipid-A-disaccharide synthase n=1 Tax=Devosia sp. TaxID=1871048 RepID=UPI003A8CF80B